MPTNIEEALKCLEEDVAMREIFGEELVDAYLSIADNNLFSSMDPTRLRDFLIERHGVAIWDQKSMFWIVPSF